MSSPPEASVWMHVDPVFEAVVALRAATAGSGMYMSPSTGHSGPDETLDRAVGLLAQLLRP